jgi:hypothetical protein
MTACAACTTRWGAAAAMEKHLAWHAFSQCTVWIVALSACQLARVPNIGILMHAPPGTAATTRLLRQV